MHPNESGGEEFQETEAVASKGGTEHGFLTYLSLLNFPSLLEEPQAIETPRTKKGPSTSTLKNYLSP